MRQEDIATDKAKLLQQVFKEKALLEIEYIRKEGDARLAALNTHWKHTK